MSEIRTHVRSIGLKQTSLRIGAKGGQLATYHVGNTYTLTNIRSDKIICRDHFAPKTQLLNSIKACVLIKVVLERKAILSKNKFILRFYKNDDLRR